MAASAGALRRAAQRILSGGAAARAAVAGQPTPLTHPELLRPGELLPGISAAEFTARRDQLAGMLPPGGIAVLPASPLVFMAGVIPYPYRQSADFLYLTGISQPHVVAAVDASRRFTLFVADVDDYREQWDGARLGPQAATELFGAHEAYPLSQLPSRLGPLLGDASAVLFDSAQPADPACPVRALPAFQAAAAEQRVQPLRPLTHRLRWRKSAAELALMRRSARLATAAMAGCMARSRPGVSEHELAAHFEHSCKAGGAQRMAYPPVVAGGSDACTVHYSRNDKLVSGGHALLLDGGCEFHGYVSDVTRVWPVGGKFSGPQRAVYEAVLEVHRACLEACRPGATLRHLHQMSVRLLSEALVQLGVARGLSSGDLARGGYQRYYPHSVGHWLGLDTHDSNTMSHDRPLEPGVVLTVEPALYIPDDEAYGPLRGIGVRIEDDIAITATGHENLSADVPVEVEQVEQLVGSAL